MTGDKLKATRENVGYNRLITWQLADRLAQDVYKEASCFPNELYGLTAQLRRAALSVPLNIVEGHARGSKKDFRRFLEIVLEVYWLKWTIFLYSSLQRKYLSRTGSESLSLSCEKNAEKFCGN